MQDKQAHLSGSPPCRSNYYLLIFTLAISYSQHQCKPCRHTCEVEWHVYGYDDDGGGGGGGSSSVVVSVCVTGLLPDHTSNKEAHSKRAECSQPQGA
eukprot:1139475-Pelagomonas_calceolata.AAC.6